jgi:hypothetical protein
MVIMVSEATGICNWRDSAASPSAAAWAMNSCGGLERRGKGGIPPGKTKRMPLQLARVLKGGDLGGNVIV